MSDFAGLRLAATALQAQQRGVEVAAQNVANANTEGYSRQRVDLEALGGPQTAAFWSKYDGAGSGVKVADIQRFRDSLLEIRAGIEHSTNANLQVGADTMKGIEGLFNEPSDTGIAKQLSDLWSSFNDVSNHPDDPATRTQLLETANTLIGTVKTTANGLAQQRTNTINQLSATVANINQLSQSVASLNAAIKANDITGQATNDLKDKRDLLVNQLAEASGGTVQAFEYGQVNVMINGNALVNGGRAASLSVDATGTPVVLRWTSDDTLAGVTSGTAGGQLTAINSTIPSYVAKLDSFATTLRDEVNNLHADISGSLATTAQNQTTAGNLQFEMSLNGGAFQTVTVAGADWSGAGGATALQTALQTAIDGAVGVGTATVAVSGGNGSAMTIKITPTVAGSLTVQAHGANAGFATLLGTTAVGADGVGGRVFFSGTDAGTLALSSAVANNPNAVAAGLASGGPLDGSRALDIGDLAQSSTGSASSYRQLIVQLGIDTQGAQNRSDIQQKSTQSLDNARQQVSGVNLDEEMTNLVQYQHAYDAAARVLTTIDSMLDTLINHTGMTV